MPRADEPHENLALYMDHSAFKPPPSYDYLYVDEIQ
jgi:hypothetical protein